MLNIIRNILQNPVFKKILIQSIIYWSILREKGGTKYIPWITLPSVAAVPVFWHVPVYAFSQSWSWSAHEVHHVFPELRAVGPASPSFGPPLSRVRYRWTRTLVSVAQHPSSSASSYYRSVDYPSCWAVVVSGSLDCPRSKVVGCCWPRDVRNPTALIAATAPGSRLRLDHGGPASVVDNRELRHPRSRRRRSNSLAARRLLRKQTRIFVTTSPICPICSMIWIQ